MMQTMLGIQKIDEVTVVTPHQKKLYQNVAVIFREEMNNVLTEEGKNIIVDLSEVEVMNSSAIGVLIMASDQLQKRSGKFVVTGLCPLLKELFQRMKLDTILPIVETQKEAFSFIKGG